MGDTVSTGGQLPPTGVTAPPDRRHSVNTATNLTTSTTKGKPPILFLPDWYHQGCFNQMAANFSSGMENEHAYEHPSFLPAFLGPVGNSPQDLPKYNKYISDHLLHLSEAGEKNGKQLYSIYSITWNIW